MKKNYFLLLLVTIIHVKGISQNATAYSSDGGVKQRSRQFGIRGGYNIPRMAGEKNLDFKPGIKNGYTASVSFSPAARSGFGFRTEIVYSSQNFGFDINGQKTSLRQDYLYLPQFTTFGIGKFLQLQVGGQMGLLLNAKQEADGEKSSSVMSLMNRIDYGAAGGVEIYPFKGIIIGGRYNMNFGKTYKTPSDPGNINPLPFDYSDVKGRNAVINLYLGYTF